MRPISALAAVAILVFGASPVFAVEGPAEAEAPQIALAVVPAPTIETSVDDAAPPSIALASLRGAIELMVGVIEAVEAVAPPLPGVRPAEFTVGPARLVVTVSLAAQSMTVRLDDSEIHNWPVSTGRSGYATPAGAYQPYRLATMWRSRQYEDAPMPFSIFFEGGYAIHGTSSVRALGSVASHGCVRLATENAEALFHLTREVGSAEVDIVIID
jgi:lipoprotein-anchoring transpeptidase ErfK/SrfK